MAQPFSFESCQTIYPHCCRILGDATWGRIRAAMGNDPAPAVFADRLREMKGRLELPGFIDDVARIEWSLHQMRASKAALAEKTVDALTVNPALSLMPVSWRHLPAFLQAGSAGETPQPSTSPVHVMIWHHRESGVLHLREADDIDLLALKIVVEGIDPRRAAAVGNVTVAAIHAAIDHGVSQGFLLSPESRISRESLSPHADREIFDAFRTADAFTLQWHITQACDLHCKHCYDRSDRSPMDLDTAMGILDDFYSFCRRMHVRGQVTFTGGNPFLYPHFYELYQAAHDLGFGLAVLGNPTPKEQVKRLCEIAKPLLFQISLEGLAEYNDYIRGKGHFQRSLAFLEVLRDLGVYSMVMLTVTRDNLNQVMPLADVLKHRTDAFNFNRLSTVGEGAQLAMPQKQDYEAFLRHYHQASQSNAMLGLKENLLNIVREENHLPPFGGCTGFGCGAAFNFVSLLPDGEVHACRKFPSPIGNIHHKPLVEIYNSDLAQRYRRGSRACRTCKLAMVCRGCLAITHSLGLNVFEDKDPYCFLA